jgi:O-acetyl-ADP-ribose deacetylase (regulator of RNase III)
MIKTVKGSVLEATEDLICQQVNCAGKMGAGLARKIRMQYPTVYNEYVKLCNDKKHNQRSLLGCIQEVRVSDKQSVINIFGQEWFGTHAIQTDYIAFDKAMAMIKKHFSGKTIAIPHKIGCGLAGGNWKRVYSIIEAHLGDEEVTIYEL